MAARELLVTTTTLRPMTAVQRHRGEAVDTTGTTPARLGILGWIGPLAAVAVVVALPFWGLWRAPGPPMEEGFMLVFPELVLEGMVPNRDFLHLYGPGSLWALAGAFKVFGVSLEVERAFGLVQQVGVALGVVVALRPWGRGVAAAGGAMTAVILLPPVAFTALAWPGAVALGLLAVNSATGAVERGPGSRRDRRLVLAGAAAAGALLFRPDLVVALALAGAGLWPALTGRGDRLRLLGALAAGSSLYLVHAAVAGPANVLRGLVIEPVFDLRSGRRLPLPPSWTYFDGFLQRAGDTVAPPWPLPAPPSPAQLSLWIVLVLATVVLLVTGGVAARRRRGDRRLLVVALFAVGLLPQALQRADSAHLAWVSAVPLGLLPAAVLELWPTASGAGRAARRRAAAVAVPVLLTLVLVPHFTWRSYGDYVAQSAGVHRDADLIEHRGRRFYYGRRDAVEAVGRLLDDVERISRPGEALFVGTGDLRKTPYSEAFLYYLLPQLEPATRYIEMDPWVANRPDSGLAEDLAGADIVILSSIRDDWVEPNASRRLGDDGPNRVLARDFCLFDSYGAGLYGRGLYELYTRCR